MFLELSQGSSSGVMVLPTIDLFSNGAIATGYSQIAATGQRSPTSTSNTYAKIENGIINTWVKKATGYSLFGMQITNSSSHFDAGTTLVFHVASFSSNKPASNMGIAYIGKSFLSDTTIESDDEYVFITGTGYYFVKMSPYSASLSSKRYFGVGITATQTSSTNSINAAMTVDYIGMLTDF